MPQDLTDYKSTLPDGIKPLPESMRTKFHDAIWMVSLGANELKVPFNSQWPGDSMCEMIKNCSPPMEEG